MEYNVAQKIILNSLNGRKYKRILIQNGSSIRSLLFTSKNCLTWIKKNGYPLKFSVDYGEHLTVFSDMESFENTAICENEDDYTKIFQTFIREQYPLVN